MKLKTPTDGLNLVMLIFFLYIGSPVVVTLYFSEALERGDFPVNADSIAIPIAGFVVLLFISVPFILGLMALALHSYPGSVPLFTFNRERPIWSFCWSLPFALLAGITILCALGSFAERLWSSLLVALFCLLLVYALLSLNSAIVNSHTFSSK